MAFSGNLYFDEEAAELLEETIEDMIGMRINGEYEGLFPKAVVGIEDVEEIAFDDNHRSYRSYVEVDEFFPDGGRFMVLEIEPFSKDESVPLMFVPRIRRNFSLHKETAYEYNFASFKVTKGMYIEGKTTPPVADATVTIERLSHVSLQDREPKIVKTDSEGRFKVGPVFKDAHSVDISKEGHTFERTGGNHES